MGILTLTQKEEIVLSKEDGSVEFVAEQDEITDWLNSGSKNTVTEEYSEYIEICDDETDDLPDKQQPGEASTILENRAIYLAPFYYAEIGIANQLLRLLSNGKQNNSSLNTNVALRVLEDEMDMQYAPQQREAIQTALTERAMILTGGPGTGKTTTTVGMILLLEAAGRRIVLAAPTGRAAKRLSETTGREAKTIHRLLEFSFQENGFKRNRENPLDADVVIIDEMSMVDIVLMNRLMQAIPSHATVILIGDTDQLPSVGAGNVLKSLIDSRIIPVVKLTEIFRQARESMIVTNAHLINSGYFPELSGPRDRDFHFIEEEEPEAAVQLITSLIAERIPNYDNYHPIDDIQLLCPMRRGILGTQNFNKCLQDVLNPNTEQTLRGWQAFRPGDKVMQIRNNYNYDVYNGDIGRIIGFDLIDKTLQIQFSDKVVAYDMADLNELVLAYATTIHKAQGSEYPVVVIPLHTQHYIMLQRNLLYTGITRAKEQVVIVGSEKALDICIRNNQVMWRNTYLAERLNNKQF